MNTLQIAIPSVLLQKQIPHHKSENPLQSPESHHDFQGGGSLNLIAGDASDRKFYRYRPHAKGPSFICMVFPKWEGGYGGDPMSWLGMHHALLAAHIPVPEIIAVQPETHCIWTEDFGDHFLHVGLAGQCLDAQSASTRGTYERYLDALDLLIEAQYPLVGLLPHHPAQDLAFDEQKLLYELDFFCQHFLRNLLGIKDDLADLRQEFVTLSRWLAHRPRVLCHRDYHARNIMIHNGTCKWIDFQDARMGPHTYDVVSLLRDSYVSIQESTREGLFDYYLNKLNLRLRDLNKKSWNPDDYKEECLHMGLQRNIKAMGSFAYLATVKSKLSYLKFVDHTLSIIRSPEHSSHPLCSLQQKFPVTMALIDQIHQGKLNDIFCARKSELSHD